MSIPWWKTGPHILRYNPRNNLAKIKLTIFLSILVNCQQIVQKNKYNLCPVIYCSQMFQTLKFYHILKPGHVLNEIIYKEFLTVATGFRSDFEPPVMHWLPLKWIIRLFQGEWKIWELWVSNIQLIHARLIGTSAVDY